MARGQSMEKLVEKLNTAFSALDDSTVSCASEIAAAHARLDEWHAQRQAVDAALKSVVDVLPQETRDAYCAELSSAETAIPLLAGKLGEAVVKIFDADEQRERYQEAFSNVRAKYQTARERIERMKGAVSYLNQETIKLQEKTAELGQLVAHLNTANNGLTAQNTRLRTSLADTVTTLNETLTEAADEIAKRDSFIDKRYGVSINETPESAFIDVLRNVYRNFTDGNERAFDECARSVAKGAKGKALGTKEVVDVVKIVAGYETGKPGWFSNKEDAYDVCRAVFSMLQDVKQDTDMHAFLNRLRESREGTPVPVHRLAGYVSRALRPAVV